MARNFNMRLEEAPHSCLNSWARSTLRVCHMEVNGCAVLFAHISLSGGHNKSHTHMNLTSSQYVCVRSTTMQMPEITRWSAPRACQQHGSGGQFVEESTVWCRCLYEYRPEQEDKGRIVLSPRLDSLAYISSAAQLDIKMTLWVSGTRAADHELCWHSKTTLQPVVALSNCSLLCKKEPWTDLSPLRFHGLNINSVDLFVGDFEWVLMLLSVALISHSNRKNIGILNWEPLTAPGSRHVKLFLDWRVIFCTKKGSRVVSIDNLLGK